MAIISALPVTLTNGQIADASQVMQDFNQIVNNVNTNAAENGTNSSITSLTGLTTALSIGQGGTGAKTQANAFINIVAAGGTFTGDANFNANCNINGTTTISGNVTSTGTITANGNVTINRPTTINNNVTIVGTIAANGNTTVNGNVTVNGATTSNGNLTVASGSTLTLTGVTITGSGVITQTNIASSAVGQAQLKTTTGTLSNPTTNVALPGGQYGFIPTYIGDASRVGWVFTMNFDSTGGAAQPTGSGYVTVTAPGGATSWSVVQRYITASPPYNLGDGDIPLFLFALVDKSNGKVISAWSAIDPPWAYNGPTDIRPDFIDEQGRKLKRVRKEKNAISMFKEGRISNDEFASILKSERDSFEFVEIDHSIKNADMNIIPHPFMSADLSKNEIILLEPCSSIVDTLSYMHDSGEEVGRLLIDSYIKTGNEHCGCNSPNGVMAVRASWK